MEKSVKYQIKNDFLEYCNKKGYSQNVAANILGVSPATVSNLVNEKWDLISDKKMDEIKLEIESTQANLVQTASFNTVTNLCGDAQLNCKFLAVVGGTGSGKTTALKEYSANNGSVYYMVAKKSIKPKRFFTTLLQNMGILYSGTIGEMVDKIVWGLNKKPGSLLIVDEAGKLDETMFMYLHDLRDETQLRAGIVLAGVEYFKTNLEKLVTKQKAGMPEFYDRIMSWQELPAPTKAEIEAICMINGVIDQEIIGQMKKSRNFRHLSNQITNYKMIINQSNNN